MIGRKCDGEEAGNFGQDEQDGEDWGSEWADFVLVIEEASDR